jgi:hypothetical protein
MKIENYTLGAHYCRTQMLKGGVCISVNNSINFSTLNLDDYSTDKDFEVCAIQVNLLSKQFFILTIYRSPSRNFSKFMMDLKHFLQLIYNPKIDFVICGDINLNYLEGTNKVKQLHALFKTFNLSTATFFHKNVRQTSTATENIFIDSSKYDYHCVSPFHSGLSDYETL